MIMINIYFIHFKGLNKKKLHHLATCKTIHGEQFVISIPI